MTSASDKNKSWGTAPGARQRSTGDAIWRAFVLPLGAFVVLLAITIAATLYQRFEERDEASYTGDVVRTLVSRRIERLVTDTLRSMRRAQIDFTEHNVEMNQASFDETISPVVRLVTPFRMLALVTPDGRTAATWSRTPGEATPEQLAVASAPWRTAIERARATGLICAVGNGDALEDPDRFSFVVPLRRESDGAYKGAVVGYASIAELLHDLFDASVGLQFNVTLTDERGKVRTQQGDPPADWAIPLTATQPVQILDRTWQLRVVPSRSFDRGLPIREPVIIFLVGLAMSLLAAGTMLQAMLYRRRERQRARDHLDALESLNEVSAAITSANAQGAGMPLLAELAEEARRLLHMPMATILLVDEDAKGFRMVNATGFDMPLKDYYAIEEMPASAQCISSGQVIIVPDVQRDSGPLNLSQLRSFNVRAIVLIPLVVSGKPLGVIGLSDAVPRKFTDVEVRMAHLWGAQAAVVLAQSRLYDELRRQVETNQTLLRELNHRVKNNLAGIHGLLAMDQPQLSPEAHRWLDRVVSRVETMARAHELFSGGMQSVGLEELVNKTLASIRAIKPPGVRVEVDMSQLHTSLTTDRAVTLAIVLNELCYNAIVHAVGTDGSLTVRGRLAEPGIAAIDVIDHGGSNGRVSRADGSAASAVATMPSSGLGLSLVSALVGRELQGRLNIDRGPGGGTIVTVQFPVTRVKPQQQQPQATRGDQ